MCHDRLCNQSSTQKELYKVLIDCAMYKDFAQFEADFVFACLAFVFVELGTGRALS